MSGFVTIEVHDEEFQAWIKETKDAFRLMSRTMKDVAEIIHGETLRQTPYETGRLGESFKIIVLENGSKFQNVLIRMSALNLRTGYDYAWIQHENPLYKHLPPRAGDWKYLKYGIMDSENMAYELIEQDYMSLFISGGIY